MKNESILVLQGFEVERLELEGAEIVAYAILYKNSMFCSQVITHDVYRRLRDYIEEWNDVLYPGILIDLDEIISKLVAKGLVFINSEGVRVYDRDDRVQDWKQRATVPYF